MNTRAHEITKNINRFFNTNECVCKLKFLTKEEKINILKEWEYDAKSLETAECENMIGGHSSKLGEILDTIRMLKINK